ncbi:hypothetical protein W03_09550 [Nitrosomonas sp. PY1]|uniref:hypothetical protein n=1 Tax=Nitrosomonas sp. PY1 TaxID=1803906 RepID=UPI001FC8C711|nr:hypothetical protein [Nitrosomonas sp. PY1]GKS68951.1 hypothetical protein W03_09550 [Nitrosomonas sp. PY1]
MASKSTSTSARRKSIKVVQNVAANIIFIDPEIRKRRDHERWEKSVLDYKNSLSKDHQKIFYKAINVISGCPKLNEKFTRCPVIPFPIRNQQSKSMEA